MKKTKRRASILFLIRRRTTETRFAQARRVSNDDFMVPAGSEIEVMLDAGLSFFRFRRA